MSSEIEGAGIIAAAVMLPAAAAFGAGWLAWQSGKLLVEAGRAVNNQVEEKKRQLADAAEHRRKMALAAHSQLKDMCLQILAQLEQSQSDSSEEEYAELEQLKRSLQAICTTSLPEDAAQIESITSMGYFRLDSIVRQQQRIAAFHLTDSEAGQYRGLSVADLMDQLHIAIEAMTVCACEGTDVQAADPAVLERAKLNTRFAAVTANILEALALVSELDALGGLTASANAWLHSCFNDVDARIASLYQSTTTNAQLKQGIKRLEESYEQYCLMAPTIEENARKMAALYGVYVDACKALDEPILARESFADAAAVEDKLRYLQTRADRAAACARIYKQLGSAGYMCYAWDQELQAMGYAVHTRQKIAEMARQHPEYARLGDHTLPFYQWDEEDLTQLYSITSQCALQLIVHEDGTVSMQSIAEEEDADTVTTQQHHCARLKQLHQRLRDNWFIRYDYTEEETAQVVTTVAAWQASEGTGWQKDSRAAARRRAKRKEEKEKKQQQAP